MLTSKEIRQRFIDFFKSKQHTYVPSASVAPLDDPTLLFTNAGMNQFKDVFLGKGTRPYTRAVNSQKCIRVSGKHNDLEVVGLDGYHHTFFEMLGSWSFGDYYKKEAIAWAWELFTQVWKFDKTKLYATVYKTDDEAFKFWTETTDINPAHVLRFAEKDNFWEMGETGPCGPCSEIHIDLGPEACDCGGKNCGVNTGCARYRELWNLVFIQYNREADRSLKELPAKHVDTGAGLERICAVIQGVASNYDTDIFTPIINAVEKLSGQKYDRGLAGTPFRVIADHLRMVSFSISDGAIPSNEGRGYVVRRILRRALRFGRELGLREPFMYKLVDVLAAEMGHVFPEIASKKEYTKKIIEAEENSFIRTLDKGLDLFNEALVAQRGSEFTLSGSRSDCPDKIFPGDVAFKLYDTYGFPLDLTQMMAREKGLEVDQARFDQLMKEQKERARASGVGEVKKGIGGEVFVEQNSAEKKQAMACNHTATHLMHAALQKVLGAHATQKGSQVTPESLRFDFSHFQALTAAELSEVENLVNEKIKASVAINIVEKSYNEAKSEGAMSLFGEKYGDVVRVVSIADFSKELCGGGHVVNTKEIEAFKIIKESSIAAGTRRIEAITGQASVNAYLAEQAKNADLEKQKEAEKQKQKELAKAKEKEILASMDYSKVIELGGKKVFNEYLGKDISAEILQVVASRSGADVVVVSGVNEVGQLISLFSAKEKFSGGNLQKIFSTAVGGKGGGKEVARAGGGDPQKALVAHQVLADFLKASLR